MYYDAIVIGAGIAGACTAYFLKQAGLSVLVLEKNTICSGGSYPAGAFLSPKISKPSFYKSYLNEAFLFSTDFYKKNFPKLFYQCGLKKIPLDLEDIRRCKSYEPYIDIPYSKDGDDYFFPNSGIVDPVKLCTALLDGIDIKENYKVENIEDLSCKNIILATGADILPVDIPYIKRKNIAGYRYDLKFDGYEEQKYNIHKDISISAYYNGSVAVGATHIKESELNDLEKEALSDSFGLLKRAKKLQNMKNLEILKHYIGYRSSTYDYFPVLGRVIDARLTLQKYPYIKNGTKVPAEKYQYFDNLYIHSALGSRGFVFAPYNAKLLSDLITKNREIDPRLSPFRLFKKWSLKKSS